MYAYSFGKLDRIVNKICPIVGGKSGVYPLERRPKQLREDTALRTGNILGDVLLTQETRGPDRKSKKGSDRQRENGWKRENGSDRKRGNGSDRKREENGSDRKRENGSGRKRENGSDRKRENGSDRKRENGLSRKRENSSDKDGGEEKVLTEAGRTLREEQYWA